jgi:endoglucanase
VDLKAHLKKLCETPGPSGYEDAVGEALAEDWRPLVDSLDVGKSGSLIGLKKGTGSEPHRKIMLCAHMDENGLIVSQIEGGLLRVARLGGIDTRILPGAPVLVHGRRSLPGVVGVPPLHVVNEDVRGRYPDVRDLVVDLGRPAAEVAELVRVGDVITLDASLIELQNGRLAGKALDDRACVAALTACLEALQTRRHVWDVLAVASTQEEVGSRGARVEAYRLEPEIAIALDVTFAVQPGVNDSAFKLGDGPTLSLGENFHPALYQALDAAAKRLELSVHPEPTPGPSGTDAWPIQVSRDGIPTALIGLPIRNMHSGVETLDMKDLERTGRLLAEFIAGIDADFLATIVWDKPEAEKS